MESLASARKHLRIGCKVNSSLSLDLDEVEVYTGTIIHVETQVDGQLYLSIKRDDGDSGEGVDDSWSAIVNNKTYKYINLLEPTEWDD